MAATNQQTHRLSEEGRVPVVITVDLPLGPLAMIQNNGQDLRL